MKHEIEVTFKVMTKIEIEAESREEAEAKIKALDFDQIDDERTCPANTWARVLAVGNLTVV
jgi:hypothetical protein